MKTELKKTLFIWTKIIVVLAAYSFMIYKIVNSDDIHLLHKSFLNLNIKDLLLVGFVCTLSFINWGIESYKWKLIFPKEMQKNFKTSYKAVLAGITVGTLTPNRVGEFGGRILFLDNIFQKKAIIYTLIADLSQFIITIIFGLFAFLVIGIKVFINDFEIYDYYLILASGVIIATISLLLYFNLNIILNIFKRFNLFETKWETLSLINSIKTILLLKTIFYSNLRYIIFIIQFYLILIVLNIDISLFETFLAVANIYFATSIIPNIPFAEIGIRSSFSIIFLGIYSEQIALIVIASLFIYIINVVIPGFIGGYFLLKQKSNLYTQ